MQLETYVYVFSVNLIVIFFFFSKAKLVADRQCLIDASHFCEPCGSDLLKRSEMAAYFLFSKLLPKKRMHFDYNGLITK